MKFLELSSLSIRALEQVVDREDTDETLVRQMSMDSRAGVRKIARRVLRNRAAAARRLARAEELLKPEHRLWEEGFRRIAGVDEAGVGPLAGPVIAAAVVFKPGTRIIGVDDSKRIKPREREQLARIIRRKAIVFQFGVAGVDEIEEFNVYRASLLAMRRALDGLSRQPDYVLVDARKVPGLTVPQRSIIRGDSYSFSIAAASILAKTHRDALMNRLDREFPVYGFARHKGYGTPAHQEALKQHGPCPAHRRSFLRVKELADDFSPQFRQLEGHLRQVKSMPSLMRYSRSNRFKLAQLDNAERTKLQRLMRAKRRALSQTDQLPFFAEHVE